MAVLFGIAGVAENVVAGEDDALAVDHAADGQGVVGLAGHVVDGEGVAFPFQFFAGLERAVYFEGVYADAVGFDQGDVVIARRMLEHVDDAVEGPDFCAPLLAQVRNVGAMVAVHVRDDDGVNLFQTQTALS